MVECRYNRSDQVLTKGTIFRLPLGRSFLFLSVPGEQRSALFAPRVPVLGDISSEIGMISVFSSISLRPPSEVQGRRSVLRLLGPFSAFELWQS